MGGRTPPKFIVNERNLKKIVHYLAQLKDELKCPICLELLTEPLKASCNHIYCKACINKYLAQNGHIRASCPMCKNKRSVSKRSLKNVYNTNQIEYVKSLIEKLEKIFQISVESLQRIITLSGTSKVGSLMKTCTNINETKASKSQDILIVETMGRRSSFTRKNSRKNISTLRKTKSLDCNVHIVGKKVKLQKRHSVNNVDEYLTQQKQLQANIASAIEDNFVKELDQEVQKNVISENNLITDTAGTNPTKNKIANKTTNKSEWIKVDIHTKKHGRKRKQPEQLNISKSHPNKPVAMQKNKKSKISKVNPQAENSKITIFHFEKAPLSSSIKEVESLKPPDTILSLDPEVLDVPSINSASTASPAASNSSKKVAPIRKSSRNSLKKNSIVPVDIDKQIISEKPDAINKVDEVPKNNTVLPVEPTVSQGRHNKVDEVLDAELSKKLTTSKNLNIPSATTLSKSIIDTANTTNEKRNPRRSSLRKIAAKKVEDNPVLEEPEIIETTTDVETIDNLLEVILSAESETHDAHVSSPSTSFKSNDSKKVKPTRSSTRRFSSRKSLTSDTNDTSKISTVSEISQKGVEVVNVSENAQQISDKINYKNLPTTSNNIGNIEQPMENKHDDLNSVENFLEETLEKCLTLAKKSITNSILNELAEFIKKNKSCFMNNTELHVVKTSVPVQVKNTYVQTEQALVNNRSIQTVVTTFKDASTETSMELMQEPNKVLTPVRKLTTNIEINGPVIDLNLELEKLKRQSVRSEDKENNAYGYKRIRAPCDSDSDEESRNRKNAKKIGRPYQQNDFSVAFFSELEENPPVDEGVKALAQLKQTLNSDSINYDEYLEKVMSKCDEEFEYNEANLTPSEKAKNKSENLKLEVVLKPSKPHNKTEINSKKKFYIISTQTSINSDTIVINSEEQDSNKTQISARNTAENLPASLENSINLVEKTEELSSKVQKIQSLSEQTSKQLKSTPHQSSQKYKFKTPTTKVTQINTLAPTEFEEMFKDYQFTDTTLSQVNATEQQKSKNSERILSCPSNELVAEFEEPFETSKHHSESIDMIESTEFTCKPRQKNTENRTNEDNLSVDMIEGTEFTCKMRPNITGIGNAKSQIDGAVFTCKLNENVRNDAEIEREIMAINEISEASFSNPLYGGMILGRESPTLFSPVPSDEETIIESTPPKKKPVSLENSFILPPPPEECDEIVEPPITLPISLLVPPKEFQSDELPESIEHDKAITSTQHNGNNFKQQSRMDNSLEYSINQLHSTQKGPTSQNTQCSVAAIPKDPIISITSGSNSPLTIEKPKKPQPTVSLTTGTVQSTILNFVKNQDNNKSMDFFPSSAAKKPCIACTRLSKDKILAINSLCTKKLATYSKDYSSTVTHMVVSTSEENCIKDHTFKFLSAVSAGIWVVSFGWIEECLKQGKMVNEEPYEVQDVSGTAGPRISRLTRLSNPLLKNYRIYCAPPFQTTTLRDLEEVLRNLGATIVHKPEDLKKTSTRQICLIVTEARYTQDFEQYEEWLERYGIITVDLEWLSRSVGQYSVISLRPYVLCSEDNLESLGYPPELLINIPESELTCS